MRRYDGSSYAHIIISGIGFFSIDDNISRGYRCRDAKASVEMLCLLKRTVLHREITNRLCKCNCVAHTEVVRKKFSEVWKLECQIIQRTDRFDFRKLNSNC